MSESSVPADRIDELVELARRVREAQKDFFASFRLPQDERDTLRDKAKALEREFDEVLAGKWRQSSMFDRA